MDFRDRIASETYTSLGRVLARRSDVSLRELAAFNKALGEALLTLESSLAAPGEDQHYAEMVALVERLAANAKAAQDKAETALQDARQQIERHKAQAASLTGRLDESAARIASLEQAARDTQARNELTLSDTQKRIGELSARAEAVIREAETAHRQNQGAKQALEDELRQQRAALDRTRTESAATAERLAVALNERKSLEAALHDLQGRWDQADAQRTTLAKQLETSATRSASLERAARDTEDARSDLQQKLDASVDREARLQQRLATADEEIKQVRAEAESMALATLHVERALSSAKAKIEELTRQRPPAVVASTAVPLAEDFDRLNGVYQDLESGKSVTEVLTTLAKSLSDRFPRAVLFNVNGNALQGLYQAGFETDKDITKIIIPLALDSVLSRAVASGRIETTTSEDPPDNNQLPFGEASAWCMALPVSIGGEPVAVIYTDDGHRPHPDATAHASRLAFADVSRRHAISVLAKLSVDLKELTELRGYAALLLDEVEYIYGADVSAGKQNIELVEHLAENLRCAQETYARRLASATVRDSGADLFEERLNGLIDAKGATSFGRHLSIAAASIVKLEPAADSPASPRVAQAS